MQDYNEQTNKTNRIAKEVALSDYLDAVIPETPENVEPVFCVLTDAPADGTPWPPITERAMLSRARQPDGRAFYMSTMLAKRGDDGKCRNRKTSFWGLMMLVLDDVGSKVDPNALRPTHKIETSAGNFQWIYVLREPVTDQSLAERLVDAVYEADLSDKGGKMVNKFTRLPVGINGKMNGDGRNTFAVRLVDGGGPMYSVEELVEGFGVELAAEAQPGEGVEVLAEEDYRQARDPVVEWLREQGLVLDDSGGEFIDIVCPWHHSHTNDDQKAGYSPLGRGSRPDTRGYHCFHSHQHSTVDFLEWVSDQGGPSADVWDPILPMVQRYVLLEYSNEVADTWASAKMPYPIVGLSNFKNAHRQFIPGPRGAKQYFGDLWLEHRDTLRARGRTYLPGGPPTVMVGDKVLLNTYRPIEHPAAIGRPDVYLDHIAWLIPDQDERELYHDWIAQKLQHPGTRSFALVLVADIMQGETGERYGTGRSMVGDILGRVFQAGVAKLDLADIVGKGDSQTAYNDWADGTQLAIVEETKEQASSWRIDLESYETVKKVVDPRPVPGVRVKPKYGRIYSTTLYCNFLLFTNHSDALQLPEDDRRFGVLQCNKGRRELAEYAGLRDFIDDDLDIARLYHWYMSRDVSQFNHIYPPSTPAKSQMITHSYGSLDEIWDEAVESINECLVTRTRLIDACAAAAGSDEELRHKAKQMARARFGKLAGFGKSWKLTLADGSQVKPRILRDNEEVKKRRNDKDFKWLRENTAN